VGAPGTSKKILVVDDNVDLRETLCEVLQDFGHTVVCAGDGGTALQLLRDHTDFDFILLDYVMPDMDGREFREHQLADPATAAVPVVILSGMTSAAAVTSGAAGSGFAELKPAAVLVKPIDIDALIRIVDATGV
jgi:CheY-like chemotaxis protein